MKSATRKSVDYVLACCDGDCGCLIKMTDRSYRIRRFLHMRVMCYDCKKKKKM